MSVELQTNIEVSIIPKNLSERDTAIVCMLAKDKALVKLQEKYISDMKAKNLELKKLQNKLSKKVSIDPIFVSTKDAAMYIDVDPSFLTKKQGSVFKLGVHFFKPAGQSIVRWDLEALKEWIKSTNTLNIRDAKLDALLKRR